MGLGLIGLLLYWIPVDQVLEVLRRYSLWELVLAILLSTGGMIVSGLKLHRVLRQSRVRGTLLEVIEAYYVGKFFNNFIPTSVGGDVVKISSLLKLKNANLRDVSFSVILERVSGIMLLAFLALGFLVVSPRRYTDFYQILPSLPGWGYTIGIAILTVGIGCWLIVWLRGHSGLGGLRKYLMDLLRFPVNHPILTFFLLGLSFGYHFLRAVIFVVLAGGVNVGLSVLGALFILPLIAFASFLPISLGGLGIREGIITVCLNVTGIALEPALAVALAYRIITLFSSTTGGILYLLRGKTFRPALDVWQEEKKN